MSAPKFNICDVVGKYVGNDHHQASPSSGVTG